MKKRGIAALIAAVFVVALCFILSFFLLYSNQYGEQYVITLPGQGSALIDPSPEVGEGNRQHLQQIRVDRTNIQAIIQRLGRPLNYQLQTKTTYFYRETQAMITSSLWRSGDFIRIDQSATEMLTDQKVLMSENWVYVWSGDDAPVRFPRQKDDDTLYRHAPSYEDILLIPSEEIIHGEIIELDGQLCLYVRTNDLLTGEIEQWYILAENGLLVYADGTLNGQMTYQTQITDIHMNVAEQDVFRLPDGNMPE